MQPGKSIVYLCATSVLALGTLITGSQPDPAGSAGGRDRSSYVWRLSGEVLSADRPLAGFAVTLHRAGGAFDAAATPLAKAATDADGAFEIVYNDDVAATDVLYVLAEGPIDDRRTGGPVVANAQPGAPNASGAHVTLTSVLGAGTRPTRLVINERTTVAAAYGMAQFTRGRDIAGPSPGLANAAGMSRNLVDLETGAVGAVLASAPNGTATSTLATFNTLANVIERCAGPSASPRPSARPDGARPVECDELFGAATPPGGAAPHNTFEALVNIARYPASAVDELFALSASAPARYAPARGQAPPAWTLALRFQGDNQSIDGPGNFTIDHEGNVWVTVNYEHNADPNVPVCASNLLLKFTPTGEYAPGSPFRGGGLSGAGYGIDIDPYGDVWVGNFGFAGEGCPPERQPSRNSVSKFRPDGTALSPDATATSGGGFIQGGISWPQGTISDDDGNIWLANCHTNTVTLYPHGDPAQAEPIGDLGLVKPFDIVDNGTGHRFVTGNGSDNVAVLGRDGSPTPASPISGGGLDQPLGIAADSRGNMWVANSDVIDVPCPDRSKPRRDGGSLTLLGPDGQPSSDSPFTGGGLTVPWGITVDGSDNVWVSNFEGKRLSHFCGADASACPHGKSTGDPISPDDTGYGFDGLTRSTAVAVDPSGNVWVTNNWTESAIQTNPGGHEVVVFIGLATPVQRPAPRPRPTPRR